MTITTAEAQAQACGLTGYLAQLCLTPTSGPTLGGNETKTISDVLGTLTNLLATPGFDATLNTYITDITNCLTTTPTPTDASAAAGMFLTAQDVGSGLKYYEYFYVNGISPYFKAIHSKGANASSYTIFACILFMLSTNPAYEKGSAMLVNFINGDQGGSCTPYQFAMYYLVAYYQLLDTDHEQAAFTAALWLTTGPGDYKDFITYFHNHMNDWPPADVPAGTTPQQYLTPGFQPSPFSDSFSAYFIFQYPS